MMKVLILLVAIVAGASAQNHPVSKVITLLKDMRAQMEKEGEDDAKVAETMACWCDTNDKEKSKSIADAEQRSVNLGAAIEEGTASSARLNTEIKAAERQLAQNGRALDTATALRQQQLAEFNGEEKDMLQSINALKSALTVIAKHGAADQARSTDRAAEQAAARGGFLQTETESTADSNELINVKVMLRDELRRHGNLLSGAITHREKRALNAFVQEDQSAGNGQPQGGEVFGLLKNMKETFEANLGSSTKEEADNVAAYRDMKAAKEKEMAAGQTLLRMKTNELGDTDEKLANDKQDLEDTTNQLAADRKFLATVKDQCAMFDQEFAERRKTRQEETEAVSKALTILSGDDAHDLFGKTFNNAAFLQERSSRNAGRRSQASAVLVAAAKKAQDPRLSALASRMRLNAFGKVKDTLDAMIEKLEQEGEDEINHRDWCIEEINENDKITELKDQDKEHTAAKIEDLVSTIDSLTSAINQLKAEIAEMQVQMKRAGEDREMANADFNRVVSDQRATKAVLQKALDVLKGFYDKKSALLQKAGVRQTPPAGFKTYKTNENQGGVMGMIQQIISEADNMEAEAIHAESDAQVAYEDFIRDTNDSIEAKTLDITNKSETRAQAEADKTEEDVTLEDILAELQKLSNQSNDLHSNCDFLLKNFELKQSARNSEIDALKQSIGILSGAAPR